MDYAFFIARLVGARSQRIRADLPMPSLARRSPPNSRDVPRAPGDKEFLKQESRPCRMATEVCGHVGAREEAMRPSVKALTGVAVLFAAATVAPGMGLEISTSCRKENAQ